MKNLILHLRFRCNSAVGRSPVACSLHRAAHCARGVLITLVALCTSGVQATATYYSTGSADVNTLTHWSSARDGSGTSPANFAGGDIFVIQNGHSMTTTAPWALSGTGNEVQIENGGMLTAMHLAATAAFQVDNGGTYVHNAASDSANGSANDIPGSTSRSFGESSIVEIQKWANGGASPVALPAGVAWGNLKVNVASLGGAWHQSGGLAPVGFLPYLQN